MKVYIILPVYNEETVIKDVILDLKKDYDNIVVINDGSTDNSLSELYKVEGITILNHIINRGQGAALRTGTNFALKDGADVIVHFDADGQHKKEYISSAVKCLSEENVDIVLGSRFNHIDNDIPFLRKIFLKLAIVYMWFFTGIMFSDPQNGFRVLSKEGAKKIKIFQDRMAHCSEILIQLSESDLKFKELPIKIEYSEYSVKKGKSSLNIAISVSKDLIFEKILRIFNYR